VDRGKSQRLKYYIGFPISFHCNQRCSYCFNAEFYQYIDKNIGVNKWRDQRPFSLDQFKSWVLTHLSDSEIIIHLFGGEPFCSQNVDDVFEIIESLDFVKFDLLSNGIGDLEFYKRLTQYSSRLSRVGFTFHRTVIKSDLISRFENNVLEVYNAGIPVYVKELLILDQRDGILANKRFWLDKGISFKIQDFKGYDRGFSNEEQFEYKPIDRLLIDSEFKHYGKTCSCLKGYKNLFVRGFDMADVYPKGGDVIACWYDPTVIGNVIDNWFDESYFVNRTDGKIDVSCKTKLYRGTFEKDLYIPQNIIKPS
jgi:hypothetical protein